MQIIPVIDLKSGAVVHAVRGERDHYRPIESQLCIGSQPADVADAFATLGFASVYVADLDAIERGTPNTAAVDSILETGLSVWLDAGFGGDVPRTNAAADVVLGLESLPSITALEESLASFGPNRIVLSLDHRQGAPITKIARWRNATIAQIATELIAAGVRRMIDLDLSSVGSCEGPQGRILEEAIRSQHDGAFVAVGGGVRSMEDVRVLEQRGYDAVLIATALHTGTITMDQLRPFLA